MDTNTIAMNQFLTLHSSQTSILISFGSLVFEELPMIVDRVINILLKLNCTIVVCVG